MPFHPPIPNSKQPGKHTSVVSAIIQAEKLGQIALILPCSAFIGWLAGAWIGSRMHQVWPGALGVVFGGAAGLVYVIRMAMDAVNDSAYGGGRAEGSPNKSGSEDSPKGD